MDSDQTTTAWVPSKTVDGEWHLAKVVAQGEDGQVTLETLDTKETHTQPSDVSGAALHPLPPAARDASSRHV